MYFDDFRYVLIVVVIVAVGIYRGVCTRSCMVRLDNRQSSNLPVPKHFVHIGRCLVYLFMGTAARKKIICPSLGSSVFAISGTISVRQRALNENKMIMFYVLPKLYVYLYVVLCCVLVRCVVFLGPLNDRCRHTETKTKTQSSGAEWYITFKNLSRHTWVYTCRQCAVYACALPRCATR